VMKDWVPRYVEEIKEMTPRNMPGTPGARTLLLRLRILAEADWSEFLGVVRWMKAQHDIDVDMLAYPNWLVKAFELAAVQEREQ